MFHCMRYFNNSELCSFARAAALAWADHWGYCGPAGINTAVYRQTDQIVCLIFEVRELHDDGRNNAKQTPKNDRIVTHK